MVPAAIHPGSEGGENGQTVVIVLTSGGPCGIT